MLRRFQEFGEVEARNYRQRPNVVVQSLSHVRFFLTLWTAACQASLSFTISRSLLKLMSIWVSDAIQPSHPLLAPSPPAFNLSQCQGLFPYVSSSHQVAQLLELQLQHQSFRCKLKTDFLYDWLVGSPCRTKDSQESSLTQSKSI